MSSGVPPLTFIVFCFSLIVNRVYLVIKIYFTTSRFEILIYPNEIIPN